MTERRLRIAILVSLGAHGLLLAASRPPIARVDETLAPLTASLVRLPPASETATPDLAPEVQKLPVRHPRRNDRPTIRTALTSAPDSRPSTLADSTRRAAASVAGTVPTASDTESPAAAARSPDPGPEAPGRAAMIPPPANGPVLANMLPDARPASAGDADAVRTYRLLLASKARAFKRYPAQAMSAGWSGTTQVRVNVAQGGLAQAVDLEKSSGHEALDRAAIAMIEAGAVRAQVPERLRGRAFAVTLPVVFDLESN